VVDKVRPLLGQEKVADYIPALADVNPNKIGIAVTTIDGTTIGAGDYLEPFSIQSISTVFAISVVTRSLSLTTWWQTQNTNIAQGMRQLLI